MIYKNDKWQIVNKKEQIDDIYDCNEVILENWYDDYKEKHPNIIQSFQRYLKNKDGNDTINHIKDEILLMLYNNRTMLQLMDAYHIHFLIHEQQNYCLYLR